MANRWRFGVLFFLLPIGCTQPLQYTTHTEYVENRTVSPQKGWQTDYKASYTLKWE